MIKLPKRVGSIGGLSLETMEVVAKPTLQIDVFEKMDFKDILNPESVKKVRNGSYIVPVKSPVISKS